MESNQFQVLLVHEIDRLNRETGWNVPVEEVPNTGNKISRIHSLQPWLRNGTVRFSRRHTLLLEQLRDFPKGRYDDGPDALEMAIRLAHEGSGVPSIRIIRVGDDDEDDDANWRELD